MFVRTVPHALDGGIVIIVAGQVCRDRIARVKLKAASKTIDCAKKIKVSNFLAGTCSCSLLRGTQKAGEEEGTQDGSFCFSPSISKEANTGLMFRCARFGFAAHTFLVLLILEVKVSFPLSLHFA